MERNERKMEGNERKMKGNERKIEGNKRKMEGNEKKMKGNERKMERNERKMEGNERKMKRNERKMNGNNRKMEKEMKAGLFTYSDPGEVIAASNVGVLVVVVVLCPVDLDHLWAKVGISNQPIYPSTCHRPSWDPNIFVVVKKP